MCQGYQIHLARHGVTLQARLGPCAKSSVQRLSGVGSTHPKLAHMMVSVHTPAPAPCTAWSMHWPLPYTQDTALRPVWGVCCVWRPCQTSPVCWIQQVWLLCECEPDPTGSFGWSDMIVACSACLSLSPHCVCVQPAHMQPVGPESALVHDPQVTLLAI